MWYRIILRGLSPLVCRNGAAGLDTRSAANIEKAEITRKKTSDRTEVDDVRRTSNAVKTVTRPGAER